MYSYVFFNCMYSINCKEWYVCIFDVYFFLLKKERIPNRMSCLDSIYNFFFWKFVENLRYRWSSEKNCRKNKSKMLRYFFSQFFYAEIFFLLGYFPEHWKEFPNIEKNFPNIEKMFDISFLYLFFHIIF